MSTPVTLAMAQGSTAGRLGRDPDPWLCTCLMGRPRLVVAGTDRGIAASAGRGNEVGATRKIRFARSLGLLALLVVFAISLAVRSGNIWDRPLLSHDEDATGHVLATMRAMDAAPVAVHKYLPIITLSQRPSDRGIANFAKASVADRQGNYYYVSFPPMGFAIPALVFRGLGLAPTLIHLRLFTAALGLMSAGLLYLLALRLLRPTMPDEPTRVVAALCFASLMLLNCESLWIFGNVYWHHVLLEPLLVWALLLVAQQLDRPNAAKGVLLGTVLLVACAVEWAALPFAGGIALLGLYRLIRRQGGAVSLLVAGSLAPAAALLFILWHFAQVDGLKAYLDVLQNRTDEHGWGGSAPIQAAIVLAPIYLPVACLALALFRRRRPGPPSSAVEYGTIRAVLFCAAAGAVESIALIGHTAKYTYGSLPLTTLVLLLLLFLFAWSRAPVRLLATGTASCAVVWLVVYFVQNPPGLAASPFGRQFDNLAEIPRRAAADEMVFTNLAFPLGVPLARTGRNLVGPPNIAEEAPLAQMQRVLARSHAARGKLFLFDMTPQRFAQWVWWPYTKSAVIERPERRYGPLAAVISFDHGGVTAISVRRDASGRRILHRWLSRQRTAR